MKLLALVALSCLAGVASAKSEETPEAVATLKGGAPKKENFLVEFTLRNLDGKKGEGGVFIMQVYPKWAPRGAERFKELVEQGFFEGVRFFRVIKDFMAQFGIHGTPSTAAAWRKKRLLDDPVKKSNTRGMVSFATSGRNSRTTQVFINFDDNSRLDKMDFAPFAKVIRGMRVVDRIFKCGEEPKQGKIHKLYNPLPYGGRYLKIKFPRLTFIKQARIIKNVAESRAWDDMAFEPREDFTHGGVTADEL